MRLHPNLPARLHAKAHVREPFEESRLHESWELNRGLIFALSSILIAWALFAVATLTGLSGGLNPLPFTGG